MKIFIIDCFDTSEHRVDLLYKILTEAGHKVYVNMSDYRHIDKVRRVERKKDYNFFTARHYRKNISIGRLLSHVQLSQDIFDYLEKDNQSIDMLWVMAPPNSFICEAAHIKQRYPHIKLIIDLIDLWPESMPIGKWKKLPFFYMWKMLRDRNLKYADIVVTECNLYHKTLGKMAKQLKFETLYLAREDRGYIPNLSLPDGKVSLCYLGSINNIIDIDEIKEIIRQCRKQKPVIFHIIGDGEKRVELIKAAREAGAKTIFHGKIYDRNEKQRIFDSCYYGLNIMKKTVCVGLTMKSLDYFEFGIPLLNNIKGDTWNIIEKYGCGVNFRGKLQNLNFNDNNEQRVRTRKFFESHLSETIFRKKLVSIIEHIN